MKNTKNTNAKLGNNSNNGMKNDRTARNNANNSTVDSTNYKGDMREIRNQGDMRDVTNRGGGTGKMNMTNSDY